MNDLSRAASPARNYSSSLDAAAAPLDHEKPPDAAGVVVGVDSSRFSQDGPDPEAGFFAGLFFAPPFFAVAFFAVFFAPDFLAAFFAPPFLAPLFFALVAFFAADFFFSGFLAPAFFFFFAAIENSSVGVAWNRNAVVVGNPAHECKCSRAHEKHPPCGNEPPNRPSIPSVRMPKTV